MKRQPIRELPVVGEVFNLAGETGDDPFRLERERWAEAQRQADARAYADKFQRQFAECPGFISCDAPSCDSGRGMIVVEPGRAAEARDWLKRRLHVSDNLEMSGDCDGLVFEVAPRVRKKLTRGVTPRRVRVNFAPVEQFEFQL